MPRITLPCSICDEDTDTLCAHCRQPACFRCLRDRPAKNGKGGTNGYWCSECAAGRRAEVKVARLPVTPVTRVYLCMACNKEFHRVEMAKRFTMRVKQGLSDEEKMRALFQMHRRDHRCRNRGVACVYTYHRSREEVNKEMRHTGVNRDTALSPRAQPMRLTCDEPFRAIGLNRREGAFHLRIYTGGPGELPVAIATELDDNPGASITNAAEQYATAVWNTTLRDAAEGFVWIEHYAAHRPNAHDRSLDAETFDVVTFQIARGRTLSLDEKIRSSISGDERWPWGRVSRAWVETLIGQPFPVVPGTRPASWTVATPEEA